ncbi:MAG TPA: amidophosphoribosyltransferase [Clostridiales bacterium]|nr:amidophosphoribosyltransferase [Clostridiales bacterium]
MSIHEECGVFGAFSQQSADLASLTYYGLYALQHRGQESCGIVVNDDGLFTAHHGIGLVNEVFARRELESFPKGQIAVGHVRYGTTGGVTMRNCQPIQVNHLKGKLAIAHNGNLSNALILRSSLELSGAIFHSTSDTETIAYVITRERLSAPSIQEAVYRAMARLEGAYSLVMMSSTKLIAVRDPHGFRPLCYGRTPDGTYVVASESCALTAVGASFERDLLPGEIVTIDQESLTCDRRRCGTAPQKTCIFEYIYFARPDSTIDGVNVHAARVNAGRILAKAHPVEADLVIGVPDSGLDAAIGYSRESGIPYGIGLIKNKYIGRTFISPGQDHRVDQVKIKLSPIESELRGKRVVLVDDSIVRGTTCARIVSLLRGAGAKEIHMRISAPPFLHPCYYGTDIDSRENLIACQHSIPEITGLIGADSLGYLPLESLPELCGGQGYCSACFSGEYPTEIPEDTRKDQFEQKLSDGKGNRKV